MSQVTETVEETYTETETYSRVIAATCDWCGGSVKQGTGPAGQYRTVRFDNLDKEHQTVHAAPYIYLDLCNTCLDGFRYLLTEQGVNIPSVVEY